MPDRVQPASLAPFVSLRESYKVVVILVPSSIDESIREITA